MVALMGIGLLFMAGLAALRRARSRPVRPGSLLAPFGKLARLRVVVAMGVGVAYVAALVVAFESFDLLYDGPGPFVALALATGPSLLAMVVSLGSVASGVKAALRIRSAILRVRRDAERSESSLADPPAIDFGTGDARWIFRTTHAARYREMAGAAVWARGTPPPAWSPFVAPALDAAFAVAYLVFAALPFFRIWI